MYILKYSVVLMYFHHGYYIHIYLLFIFGFIYWGKKTSLIRLILEMSWSWWLTRLRIRVELIQTRLCIKNSNLDPAGKKTRIQMKLFDFYLWLFPLAVHSKYQTNLYSNGESKSKYFMHSPFNWSRSRRLRVAAKKFFF